MKRKRFSERNGHRAAREAIQVASLDGPTRTAIWNCLLTEAFSGLDEFQDMDTSNTDDAVRIRTLWTDFFSNAIDDLDDKDWYQIKPKIRSYIETEYWYDVYDLLEAILEGYSDDTAWQSDLVEAFNEVFIDHVCGYRFLGDLILPITSESELEAIEESLTDSNDLVSEHFNAALELLSDRKSPDYRNSIKESISAVEAMAREISGKPKATLAEAIKIASSKHAIHPALEKGLQQLYGFAGDASGVRHALKDTDESDVGLADAKLVLVVCSALCNFLRETTASPEDTQPA